LSERGTGGRQTEIGIDRGKLRAYLEEIRDLANINESKVLCPCNGTDLSNMDEMESFGMKRVSRTSKENTGYIDLKMLIEAATALFGHLGSQISNDACVLQ